MSAYDDRDPVALDRLEDLLQTYCEARLAPRQAVLARIRANVLAAAATAAASGAGPRSLRLVEPAPKLAHRPTRPSLPPRFTRAAFALGFAATLTLGTTAAVVAAPPGSPFYDARVYLETITLPARGDARLQGHERLLQERLAEAESAATRADGVGLAAALAAYQAEVNAATTDAGDDAALLAHLEEVLATHTDVLTELASRLPDQAAIEHAIDASSKAIDKIKNRVPPDHPSHPSGGSQNQGQGPR